MVHAWPRSPAWMRRLNGSGTRSSTASSARLPRSGVTSDGFSVTLTVEASCATDAPRIGEWMVRAALAACGFDAPAYVRAEIAFSED